MSVNIRRRADLGVTQALGNGNAVYAVEVKHGGHCVAESVGVDMGEAVTLAKPFQPNGNAVRVNGRSVVL